MRPFHRNSNVRRGGGGGGRNGPLLTEHLRDLDLELELLKRKREMIEKQQSLLNQEQAFNRQSYNYEQPPSYREQHYDYNSGPQFSSNSNRDYSSSNFDFSQLYKDSQQSRDTFPRQSAKKRLGDYVWSGPPEKRPFNTPKKVVAGPSPRQPKFVPPSERPGFEPFHNQPPKPKPSQRFRERPQKPRPNDFKPTKVTKAVPNKPSTNISKNHATPPKADSSDQILHPDQTPTQQMAGRLELALGSILKGLKDKYGNEKIYAPYFGDNKTSREMKQVIRERVRGVMLGKPVLNMTQIMKVYRQTYSEETDKEVLDIVLKKRDTRLVRPTTFVMATEMVNPYQFFKRNYIRLMSVSLNKMFDRLEALNKAEAAEILKAEAEAKEKANDSNADEVTNQTETIETPKEDLQGDENAVKNQDVDNADKNEENKEGDVPKAEHEEGTGKDDASDVAQSQDMIALANTQIISEIRKKYENMMSEMIPPKLAQWLPRLKSQILRALGTDLTFERAKHAILNETNNRIASAKDTPEAGPDTANVLKTLGNRNKHHLPYHVKIQGRPTLPKKNIMTEFLNQFNPKSIKKVKNVRNLLYVGFDNKDDFDRMVAANGSTVGNAKIIVKISQWVMNDSKAENEENAKGTPDTSVVSDGGDVFMQETSQEKELNDSLNDQIDELLTSIRNEEEAADGEGNNEVADEKANETDAKDDGTVDLTESEKPVNDAEVDEAIEDASENNENGGEDVQGAPENVAENVDDDTKVEEAENENDDTKVDEVENVNDDAQAEEAENENDEAKDKVEELKSEVEEVGRATPTRASSRLANAPSTPSSIRTRRSSKLAQN